jgi:3-deoxy-D-manno-octulosonate 8-phosphate phosphatase KdsC-like HAD superfamily phosphatase
MGKVPWPLIVDIGVSLVVASAFTRFSPIPKSVNQAAGTLLAVKVIIDLLLVQAVVVQAPRK